MSKFVAEHYPGYLWMAKDTGTGTLYPVADVTGRKLKEGAQILGQVVNGTFVLDPVHLRSVVTPEAGAHLRQLITNRVKAVVGPEPVALAMSGGIDSMTVFFALLDLKKEFTCYCFYQDGIESPDLVSSRQYCSQFNVPLVEICLPSDPDTVYADCVRTIPFCGVKLLKTKVETLRPLMYLFEAVKEHKILNGSSADDFQPYKRKANIAYETGGEDAVRKYRLSVDLKPDAYDVLSREMASAYNKEFVNVYACSEIENFYLQFTYKAITVPHKALTVQAFAPEFEACGGARKHSSYQVNSRITDVHEQLLASKYNWQKHQAVIGLYNQMKYDIKNPKLDF
jgi:hypothetical protein